MYSDYQQARRSKSPCLSCAETDLESAIPESSSAVNNNKTIKFIIVINKRLIK